MQNQDIVFVDVPAFEAEPSPINLKNVMFFRKALAQRLKFTTEASIPLVEAVNEVFERGYTLLGQAELTYLLGQNTSLDRRFDLILTAKPYQMPIIIFPGDNRNAALYPALASASGWTKVGVRTCLPVCSHRFLLPVYNPRT